MTVYENLIFNPPDVQFVHHRNTLALFSPPTVDIVYKSYSITSVRPTDSPVDYLWFTPCSVLWTTRRSRGVPTEYEWRLQTTTWWITSEQTKEYFSTLKDIQLFSTGSHCCAQLVSFWLRAMDSPWEPNCTQHDSTDRYAIGITEVIRPVYIVMFRLGQWCTQRQPTTGKANGHNVVHMRVLTAILKYPYSVHVAHNGYCYSAVNKYHNVKLAWYTNDK